MLSHAEAVEEDGRVGFRSVAALFADDAFEFAETHAVGVGERVVRLGVERVAFFEGFPERGVAHDYGVDDAELVEGELVLAKDAELFGAGDGCPWWGSSSPVRIFIRVDLPAPLGPLMA